MWICHLELSILYLTVSCDRCHAQGRRRLLNPEHLIVLLAGPVSHISIQYMDFVEIFYVSQNLFTICFAHFSGCWASFVYSCCSILGWYNLFFGFKLSIRLFCFISLFQKNVETWPSSLCVPIIMQKYFSFSKSIGLCWDYRLYTLSSPEVLVILQTGGNWKESLPYSTSVMAPVVLWELIITLSQTPSLIFRRMQKENWKCSDKISWPETPLFRSKGDQSL